MMTNVMPASNGPLTITWTPNSIIGFGSGNAYEEVSASSTLAVSGGTGSYTVSIYYLSGDVIDFDDQSAGYRTFFVTLPAFATSYSTYRASVNDGVTSATADIYVVLDNGTMG